MAAGFRVVNAPRAEKNNLVAVNLVEPHSTQDNPKREGRETDDVVRANGV